MENTEIAIMSKKTRVGRPAKSEADQWIMVPVRLPPGMVERLDNEAMARGDQPPRSVLIRKFIDDGLTEAEKARKRR
jgi:hypothetical protein